MKSYEGPIVETIGLYKKGDEEVGKLGDTFSLENRYKRSRAKSDARLESINELMHERYLGYLDKLVEKGEKDSHVKYINPRVKEQSDRWWWIDEINELMHKRYVKSVRESLDSIDEMEDYIRSQKKKMLTRWKIWDDIWFESDLRWLERIREMNEREDKLGLERMRERYRKREDEEKREREEDLKGGT